MQFILSIQLREKDGISAMKQVAISAVIILAVQSMARGQLFVTHSDPLCEQLAFKKEVAITKEIVTKYHIRSINLWGNDSGKTVKVSRLTFDRNGNMESYTSIFKDTYAYNEWNMLIRRTEVSDTSSPDDFDVYKYDYNLGQLISVENENANGNQISQTIFVYEKGRLSGSSIEYNDGSGEYRLYKFSAKGYLTQETDVDRQAGKVSDYRIFKYDTRDNVREENHGSEITKYRHDLSGRRLSEVSSGHNYITGANTTRIVYHYDKQGKPLDECWVNGKGITIGREWFTYTHFDKGNQ
jgi:hypothetical protein